MEIHFQTKEESNNFVIELKDKIIQNGDTNINQFISIARRHKNLLDIQQLQAINKK